MKKYFQLTIPVTFLLIIFTCCNSWTTEILVGIGTGYPPYYYKNNGKLTGICIEIVDHVAQESGVTVSYKEFPWKRLLSSARKGHVDAVMPLFKTAEREQFLLFDGLGLAYETNYFFTSKENSIPYNGDITLLNQYKIGVVTDYSYGDKFDTYPALNKIVTRNDQHLLEMYAHNRFDIGIGNKYVTQFYANKLGVADDIVYLEPPITQNMLYLGFTQNGKKTELAKIFSKNLSRLKKTGQYQDIINRYLNSE